MTTTTMAMQLSAAAEDYLERLYTRDVEGHPAPVPNVDDAVIGELLRRDYLRQGERDFVLTKAGLAAAESAVRRHRLAERLLHDVINVHGEQVDRSACEFEHSLHHGVDDNICTLLGHPTTCPHGRPIPRGRCCRKRHGATRAAICSLAEMKAGERGAIAYLSSRQPETVQKLMALGALPGAPVTVIQTFPGIVFQINQTQIAVDKELAADVYIRLAGEEKGRGR